MIESLWVYEAGFVGVSALSAVATWRWTGAHLEPVGASRPQMQPLSGRAHPLPPDAQNRPPAGPAPHRTADDAAPTATTAGGEAPEQATARDFAPKVEGSACLDPWTVRWIARDGTVEWIANDRVGVLLCSTDDSASRCADDARRWLAELGSRPGDVSEPGAFASVVWPQPNSPSNAGAAVFWAEGGWALVQGGASFMQRDRQGAAVGPAFARIESDLAVMTPDDEQLGTDDQGAGLFSMTRIPGPALRVIEAFETSPGSAPVVWITRTGGPV